MIRIVRMAAGLGLVSMLTACVGLPPYKAPPPGEGTAVVDVSRLNLSSVCHGGKAYSVGKVKDNKLVVPADGRMGFFSFLYISEYYSSYSCMPGVSFKPEAGREYLLNFELDGEKCWLEAYRKGAANRTGLDIEPTVAPGQYCR